MGRVKLKIKKLDNQNGRQATFAKRKNGILKKANELSILCDIDILLLMFSPTGKPSLCCGKRSSIEEVIAKFIQITPQDITKRKLDNLEVLKKTFEKLDHDVNLREFTVSSTSRIEDLSTQVKILQGRISEIHGRLNYWTEPDKINNVEHLGQLEILIRQSLDQLRAHKEHLGHQQQAMQLENENFVKDWSTYSMQDGIQIPLEQQLQSMSWILNNDTKREVEGSANSSFGSYPGYFGTGKSPVSGQETSFLDELTNTNLQQQFVNHNNITAFNPILQNDLNQDQRLSSLHPPVYNLPRNGFLEPPGSSTYNNNNIDQTWFGSSSLPCSVSMFDEYLLSQMQQPN